MTQGMDRHSETEIPYFQEFYFEKWRICFQSSSLTKIVKNE